MHVIARPPPGGSEEVGDNLAGRVPLFLAEAGFSDVSVRDVAFGGVIKLFAARKPAATGS
jgi:hypothetical protein